MNHKTVMPMPGDVVLVHRKWRGFRKEFGSYRSYLASRKIQRDTDSPWNHAAILKSYTQLVEAQERVKPL